MMDIFRVPKFTYYLYQSQRDPRAPGVRGESVPMVFIASYWTPRGSPTKVVVFSNCDEVELQLNGETLARQAPDAGPTTRYNPRGSDDPTFATVGTENLDMSGGDPFDGGNSEHVAHPPFTFLGVPWKLGELRAKGYLDGRAVAEHTVRTPGAPAAIELSFDLSGRALEANGADTIFVRASVVDVAGTVVPTAGNRISFELQGPGEIVGPACVSAEAGIATVMLRAGVEPGEIALTARSMGLSTASGQVRSLPGSPAG
jgi:beta-galactosidase